VHQDALTVPHGMMLLISHQRPPSPIVAKRVLATALKMRWGDAPELVAAT